MARGDHSYMADEEKAELEFRGQKISLPIRSGTNQSVGIDVSDVYERTGAYVFDPTLNNTAIAGSEITWIDSDNGKLRYRGFDVEELVDKSSFVEVAYLLTNGELPTQSEYAEYSTSLSKHSMIHESMIKFFESFPGDAHPLAILATMVTALSSYYPDTYEQHKREGVDVKTRLLAKVRTLAAWAYKRSIGHPVIYPRDELPYCANLLNMMFALPVEPHVVPIKDEKILNQLFILYSDHEQNIATSTVRLLGSTQANLFVCINAGICALWGAREAGVNVNTFRMLESMLNHRMSPEQFFDQFISGREPLRSPAFGHKKYSEMDPRATISRRLFHDYLKGHPGADDPLIQKGLEVEEFMLGHPHFKELGFYPNLDYYSALTFRLLNIPANMYNVFRVIGKLAGWLAHWAEQRAQSSWRKMRPQQIYMGHLARDYVPMAERK